MFILLHGPDDFTAREALASLRAAHDFGANQDTLSGAEASVAEIRNLCDTFPFLSERRLVVVEGLPKRKRGAKGDDTDDDAGASSVPTPEAGAKPAKGKKAKAAGNDPKAFAQGLADYAAHVPETTVLVVLVDELLEGSHPLLHAAQRHGRVQACVTPKGAQLESWLNNRVRDHGNRIAPEAARLLLTEVGDNLRLLANEIDKLCTYAGKDNQIRVEDVRQLTPASHQARVFDLTDALARRDRKRALSLLHELLANGESPLGIVALTAFQTRSLLQVKALAERGLRAQQIATTAGMAPFVVEKSLQLTRQFSFSQLEAAHRRLLEVDTALKRSRMTPEMALDLLVIEFGSEAR